MEFERWLRLMAHFKSRTGRSLELPTQRRAVNATHTLRPGSSLRRWQPKLAGDFADSVTGFSNRTSRNKSVTLFETVIARRFNNVLPSQ